MLVLWYNFPNDKFLSFSCWYKPVFFVSATFSLLIILKHFLDSEKQFFYGVGLLLIFPPSHLFLFSCMSNGRIFFWTGEFLPFFFNTAVCPHPSSLDDVVSWFTNVEVFLLIPPFPNPQVLGWGQKPPPFSTSVYEELTFLLRSCAFTFFFFRVCWGIPRVSSYRHSFWE